MTIVTHSLNKLALFANTQPFHNISLISITVQSIVQAASVRFLYINPYDLSLPLVFSNKLWKLNHTH